MGYLKKANDMNDQTKAMTSIGEINLLGVRLAFPDLFTPTAMKPDQPKQFGATFLVEKGTKTEAALREKIKEVAKAKWGKDAAEILASIENNPQKCAFGDGDGIEKRKLDGYAGHVYITAKNKRRPTVLNKDGSPTTEEEGVLYAGCYVNAKVEVWAQQNEHGRAIRCSLLGVVFNKRGDAFGGGRVASASELADLTSDDEDDMPV